MLSKTTEEELSRFHNTANFDYFSVPKNSKILLKLKHEWNELKHVLLI